eukprot:CAMPEP_0172869984 /NCGR_PEP_ID=MMETSP1075-20121228/90639_1 /TAXON_ID=2916 /ORGANISM="Ceratium fusus, Strain PA161109" /LENGTH=344 /DNA_ID=CAMNT_0013720053 /DNA_START=5 /DNA_END=1039 /DNA_ORIENTATION=-
MKRPAEEAAEGQDSRANTGPAAVPENPFAGVSLFSGGVTPQASGGLFAAAVEGAGCGTSNGFAALGPSNSFASHDATTSSTTQEATEGGRTANPFMGLSLFSSPTGPSSHAPDAATPQQAVAEPIASGPVKSHADETSTVRQEDSAIQIPANTDPQSKLSAQEGKENADQVPQPSTEINEPTGEEDEKVVFRAECRLWKLVKGAGTPETATTADVQDGLTNKNDVQSEITTAKSGDQKGWHWQERGCGIVHINRHSKTGDGRLVMRMRGVLKLLLNTPVFPTTKYERVGQKSVRFVGVDAEAADAPLKDKQVTLCAYRLNLQSADQQGKFLAVLQELLGVAGGA